MAPACLASRSQVSPGDYGLEMSPPPGDYRALLHVLLQLYPPRQPLDYANSHRDITHIGHGWYMRCQRGVEAVLALEAAGYQVEAAPIRRSIVEHTVGLRWLAATGNPASETVKRWHAATAHLRKESVVRADWTSIDLTAFDEVIADEIGTDSSRDHLAHFRQRCEAVGSPDDWTVYLAETQQSHPSWESATEYLCEDAFGGRGVVRLLEAPAAEIDQAGFCAVHLMRALLAVDEMLQDRPLAAVLEEVRQQLMEAISRQRKQLGLPLRGPAAWPNTPTDP